MLEHRPGGSTPSAERLGVTPDRVEGIVLGSHGETMVPVPSLTKVDGRPLRDLVDDAEIESLDPRDPWVRGRDHRLPQDRIRLPCRRRRWRVDGAGHRRRTPGHVLPVCTWLYGRVRAAATCTSGSRRCSAGRACARSSSCRSRIGELAESPAGGPDRRCPRERGRGDVCGVAEASNWALAVVLIGASGHPSGRGSGMFGAPRTQPQA